MQLTAFIVKSGNKEVDPDRTVNSLRCEDIKNLTVIFIDNLQGILYGLIESDWWIVLYDDEIVEKRLLDAFLTACLHKYWDVFSCYKIDQERKVTICPRLFQQGIRLEKDKLYPILPVKMETLLDGWIFEHEFPCNEYQSKTSQDDVLHS